MSEHEQDFFDLQDEPFETDETAVDHSMVENHDDPVLLYLREIGDIEILNAEDEFRLATLIQAGKAADRFLECDDAAVGKMILQEFTAYWNDYRELLRKFNAKSSEIVPEADLPQLLAEAASISPVESQEEQFTLYTYMNLNSVQDPKWKKVFQPLFDAFLCLCLFTKELNGAVSDFYSGHEGQLPEASGLPAKLFSAKQTETRLREIQSQAGTASQIFIRANLKLVFSVAKKYQGRGASFSDLIQEGNMGLLHAVE